MQPSVFTIGHSTESFDQLAARLQAHSVTAVADVRSSPYSRHNPQFNREALRNSLATRSIRYVFLGKELGARTDDDSCYCDGKVQYERLAQTPLFQSGIDRVVEGSQTFTISLLCAEKEPLDCHRTILVSKALTERGLDVRHILIDGSVEKHDDTMHRLIEQLPISEHDMFRTPESALREAYALQGDRIAYDRNARSSSAPNPDYAQ